MLIIETSDHTEIFEYIAEEEKQNISLPRCKGVLKLYPLSNDPLQNRQPIDVYCCCKNKQFKWFMDSTMTSL